jgi:hypothetical protein
VGAEEGREEKEWRVKCEQGGSARNGLGSPIVSGGWKGCQTRVYDLSNLIIKASPPPLANANDEDDEDDEDDENNENNENNDDSRVDAWSRERKPAVSNLTQSPSW